MSRAYLRVAPDLFERKVVEQGYPLPLFAAFVGTLCLAEHQPHRGRFRDVRVLRALLGPAGRWVPELVGRGDVVIGKDGAAYVDGWDEWQEGDVTVGERVKLIKHRRGSSVADSRGAQRTANWRLRTRIFERDAFTCRYCGVSDYPREWLVLEHVIPDGPTEDENLVTACRPCNKLKGGRTPEQAGMTLRDVSRDPSRAGVTPSSGGGGGGVAPKPPHSGGLRSDGTNPRAVAARLTREAEQSEAARKDRRQRRYLAYSRGQITEAQRFEMDERDAPLDEISQPVPA